MLKIFLFKLYQLIGLPLDILRYFGLIPFIFKKNSSLVGNFVTENILKCDYYFEYGCGFTTGFALKKKKLLRSLEMDKYFSDYFNYKQVKLINFGICKLPSIPHFFFLRKFFLKNKINKYTNYFNHFIKRLKKNKKIFLFIDGRFRLYILVNLHDILHDNIKVVLDDYKNYNMYYINKIYKYKIIDDRYYLVVGKKKGIQNIP